jgi:uncharacterized membrane protein YhaH (DUF805 family)
MPYSDTVGDNAHLLLRTIRGIGHYAGRSRRTEVIYYWIACALIGVVVDFALVSFAPFSATVWIDASLRLLFFIPMMALFVRRLHDQDRSGWWGLLLLTGFLLSVPQLLAAETADFHIMIAQKRSAAGLLLDVVWLAVLVLCILPGTPDTNRFGPDPRLEEA